MHNSLEVKQYLVTKAKVGSSSSLEQHRSPNTYKSVFCPGGSAVWPQCWLCAVCAVGHVGCCVGGGVPCGGKHIILDRHGHGYTQVDKVEVEVDRYEMGLRFEFTGRRTCTSKGAVGVG